ncbi:transposase [Xanthomonas fragariae LMG 25863]|nr:transposase [Xanthomonas fragariae LMG 25863]
MPSRQRLGLAAMQDLHAIDFAPAIAQVHDRHGSIQAISNKRQRRWEERWEHVKASVRAKVKHQFRVIKRQFGYTKVRIAVWSGTPRRC